MAKTSAKKNETNFVCPFMAAGATIVGVAVEGAPCLSTKPLKASERIEALKKAGVDTSNIFQVTNPSGDGVLMQWKNGKPVAIDDDPVIMAIIAKGTVPNRRLFRRWVTAQMFSYLTYSGGITQAISYIDYNYVWKMMEDELKAQAKMSKHGDVENFRIRNRRFNKSLTLDMCMEYIIALSQEIANLKVRHCKGKPYKRIHGINVFVDDIDGRILQPLRQVLRQISGSRNAETLYAAFSEFRKHMFKMPWKTPKSKKWIEAYKGVGAYYTMTNLIRFHGARIVDDNNKVLTEDESLAYVETKDIEYLTEGWRMIGLMKKLIEDNDIDIKKKMAEWRRK